MPESKKVTMHSRINCIVLCDISGKIKKKIYDGPGLLRDLKKEDNIFGIFNKENKEKSIRFLDDIILKGITIDWELNVDKDDKVKKYYFSGFLLEDSIFIFVLKQGCVDLSICKSILEINRDAIKLLSFDSSEEKKELIDSNKVESDDIYDSLSQLNNELINTQRQLRKKQKELETLNKKLELMTITDDLTGLYNRRHFWSKIEEELARADRLSYSIAIVSIDINDFKEVNDTLGHDEGDRVLKTFSELTGKVMRKSFDFAFRWGGDEFVLILNNCKQEQAENIMDRLNKEFGKKSDIASLSYGVVIIDPSDDIDIEEVLKEADKKMYKDKASYKKNK